MEIPLAWNCVSYQLQMNAHSTMTFWLGMSQQHTVPLVSGTNQCLIYTYTMMLMERGSDCAAMRIPYLHGVIDAHASSHRSAWGVDEQLDVLYKHMTEAQDVTITVPSFGLDGTSTTRRLRCGAASFSSFCKTIV